MNLAENILNEYFKVTPKSVGDFVYRISPQESLELILKYGSSRRGLSDKYWDRAADFPAIELKYGKLQHQDIIIASNYEDLIEDAKLKEGTFMHKLDIYKNPVICAYLKKDLVELCAETKNGPQNTGINWLFLKDPKEVLFSIWQVQDLDISNNSFKLTPLYATSNDR